MYFLKLPVILIVTCLIALLIFYPYQEVFVFRETRIDNPIIHYLPIVNEDHFEIRYTHSIHKTDVIESYKITNNSKIQLLSMNYSDLAIGLPGYAEKGQTFEEKNGKYILTYRNEILDSFTIFIANIDMDLYFIYLEEKIDLKKSLKRGKSYFFEVRKLSFYQQMKGEKIND
ncbi:DUF1850 domain-containing protein [Psychrobacillus sp. FJAT-51614]|uniref:DUF1850 domain-containing protein n=1 Tax=Psychrobacillus mangrovi TaxID=3117745 RepID=A0ABU8F0G4_9BACI